MIDVRVNIVRLVNQDAVAIQVIGYVKDEEGVVQAYQGFPTIPYERMPDREDVLLEDYWVWFPLISGQELQPSIIFPGIWTHDFDQAMRAYSGVNDAKVAAAHALGRRSEDRLDDLEKRVSSIDSAAANMGNMALEAKNLANEALQRLDNLGHAE